MNAYATRPSTATGIPATVEYDDFCTVSQPPVAQTIRAPEYRV